MKAFFKGTFFKLGATFGAVFLLFCALDLSAKDRYYGDYRKDYRGGGRGVAYVPNALYTKECASCHFGYPAGLLPSASWQHIMKTLNQHYGTDASIDESERAQIESYLVQNASERSNYKRSVKITRSLQQGTLYTSLTQIPYLQKKHRKIDKNLINQKEVHSLARCAACHKDAEKGEFSKRTVYIPNYGAWRD